MQTEPTITLSLSLSAVNTVLAALSELPLKHTIGAFLDIKAQAEKQVASPMTAPLEPVKDVRGTEKIDPNAAA